MSLRPYPGFVGPSYTSQSKIACDDRTVNWIPAKIESGTGPAEYVFDPAPGYALFCATGTPIGRAAFTLNGITWAIFGGNLFQLPIFAGGTPTLLAQGLNNPDNAPAQMVGNGDAGGQLLIMSGSTKYYLTIGAPLTQTVALTPPNTAPTVFPITPSGSAMVTGYYGYSVTFVTVTGETTANAVNGTFSGNIGGLGEIQVDNIVTGPADVVIARKLYRTTVQPTLLLASGSPVHLLATIADNTTVQFTDTFSDASLGAVSPSTNTATITVTALTQLPYTATGIAFLDGYGIAIDANRSEVRLSGLEDFSTWDPLDVFQRSDAADKWLAMTIAHKEIWLLGSQTSSVYFNSGDGDNPFIPNPNVLIQRGIGAPRSLALLNGSPIWLADDLTLRYAQGYTPQRVSNHAFEYQISQYATVLDAEGEIYNEQGHQIYVINFPTANHSWAYDLTSGLMHERGPWNGLDYDVMDVRSFINAQEMNLVLSRDGDGVYRMSQDVFVETDGVTGMVRERRAPHLVQTLNWIRYSHIRFLLEVGIGLTTGQGSDPQLMLSWSDDGGHSFSQEVLLSAGALGAYNILVELWQLGRGRDRVFKLRASDPIPWRLADAYIDFSVGVS